MSTSVFCVVLSARISFVITSYSIHYTKLYELNLASEELKIHPELLDARMGSKEMGFLDELVASFTDKYYVHNQRIRRVIEEVIRNFAVQGHTVIIGRGSGYIAP